MTSLQLDYSPVHDAGSTIRAISRGFPEAQWGPRCASGSAEVDAALDTASALVEHTLLGAAAEMYRLGNGTARAAQTFADTDRAL